MYGAEPGDRRVGLPGPLVGFMPQDICLYLEFTIQETFRYFGRLQGMESEALEKKQLVLLELLGLPEPARQVAALSGGQRRRLSFAVALLHNPKLVRVNTLNWTAQPNPSLGVPYFQTQHHPPRYRNSAPSLKS